MDVPKELRVYWDRLDTYEEEGLKDLARWTNNGISGQSKSREAEEGAISV